MTHLVFTLVAKSGRTEVARVQGRPIPIDQLRMSDVSDKVVETEQYLERLYGVRFHISSDAVDLQPVPPPTA